MLKNTKKFLFRQQQHVDEVLAFKFQLRIKLFTCINGCTLVEEVTWYNGEVMSTLLVLFYVSIAQLFE